MSPFTKFIAIFAVALHLALTSAFVPQLASSPRTTITSLHMSSSLATPPAPTKKSRKSIQDQTPSDDSSKEPSWLVRLYNDPMNKREFVARCLVEICGLEDGMAFSVMMLAHQSGLAVVGKYHRELAEIYKDRLQNEGLTTDMVLAGDDEE